MNQTEKQALYREAVAFYKLAECGRQNIPEQKFVESYIPYIVNMAFCAELYFKLLIIENGRTIDDAKKLGHNLYGLYDVLTQQQKIEIYQSFKRPLIYSIEDELKQISFAFQDWRYLVLNTVNANEKKKTFQFKPYFIKELNEILQKMCRNCC